MSTILSYITSIIQSLKSILFGFYQNKQGTVLILGLDNAGKTTLLHKLRTNTIVSFSPTERPHCETFYMNTSSSSHSSISHNKNRNSGIKFVGWDLGGHEAVRHLWDDYCMMDNIDAVLFMIDAVDYHRLEEVRDELDALVHGDDNGGSGGGRGLKRSGVPLAILLNKCDLENACSSEVVAECIGLGDIIDGYYDYHNNNNRYGDDDGNDDDDTDDIEEEYNTKYHNHEMVKLFRISVWKGEGYVDAFQWIASFL